VRIEATDHFYARADELWRPVAAEWQTELARRFSADELDVISEFLNATNELTRQQVARIARSP
jgi:hypothetical protein